MAVADLLHVGACKEDFKRNSKFRNEFSEKSKRLHKYIYAYLTHC